MQKILRLEIEFRASFLLILGLLNALPFNQDMVYTQPKTGELMFDEPPNSVPRTSDSRKFPPVEEALAITVNPIQKTEKTLQRGKRLFLAHCSSCHGVYLDGQYTPGANQRWIMGLDLSTRDMALKSDGHFYSAIIYGFPQVGDVKVMYSYRHKFTNEEAWSIVHFIRAMQEERALKEGEN
jgi:mono/diheme cytochrome c family protein